PLRARVRPGRQGERRGVRRARAPLLRAPDHRPHAPMRLLPGARLDHPCLPRRAGVPVRAEGRAGVIMRFAYATAIAALLVACGAHAQTYPAKPIRVVVPFAPGGGTDILTRIMVPRLNELLR